jgi:hypothetical protein
MVLTAAMATTVLAGCGAIRENTQPMCRFGGPTLLMAQSVSSAALVPCVRALPVGWDFHGFEARNGLSQFWLDSDVAGDRALQVVLAPECRAEGATRGRTDEPAARLYERASQGGSSYRGVWLYRFDGGCVTYRFAFPADAAKRLMGEIRGGLSFVARAELSEALRRRIGTGLNPPEDRP